jgi:hypothetical protein
VSSWSRWRRRRERWAALGRAARPLAGLGVLLGLIHPLDKLLKLMNRVQSDESARLTEEREGVERPDGSRNLDRFTVRRRTWQKNAQIPKVAEPAPIAPAANRAESPVDHLQDPLALFCRGPGLPVHFARKVRRPWFTLSRRRGPAMS